MREQIEDIVNKVMPCDYNIIYGYDCIGIEIMAKEVGGYIIEVLKNDFKTEIVWIRVNKNGNLVLCYDISKMILEWFDNWGRYEKYYDLE